MIRRQFHKPAPDGLIPCSTFNGRMANGFGAAPSTSFAAATADWFISWSSACERARLSFGPRGIIDAPRRAGVRLVDPKELKPWPSAT